MGDGYFWLSYYDQSISSAESFDYEADANTENAEYYIEQHDFMPASATWTLSSDEARGKVQSANVFCADEPEYLRAVSCQTAKPNTTVTYEAYLLDDDASGPTGGKWVDWADKVAELQANNTQTLLDGTTKVPAYNYDNFSIKAYAEPAAADDESVAALEGLVSQAAAQQAKAASSKGAGTLPATGDEAAPMAAIAALATTAVIILAIAGTAASARKRASDSDPE